MTDPADRTRAFTRPATVRRCPDCRGPLVYNHDVYCPGPMQRVAPWPVETTDACGCPAGAWHDPLCPLVNGDVARGLRQRGTGRVGPAALAYMAEPRHFMEIANHLGISKSYTGQLLHRLRSYGLIERLERGVYQRTDAA